MVGDAVPDRHLAAVFRANAQSWDREQQELRYTSAERRYLEAREDVALATTAAYFDLYSASVAVANAQTNALTNDTLYTLNKGRFEVGKIGENDLLQSELALLRARRRSMTRACSTTGRWRNSGSSSACPATRP